MMRALHLHPRAWLPRVGLCWAGLSGARCPSHLPRAAWIWSGLIAWSVYVGTALDLCLLRFLMSEVGSLPAVWLTKALAPTALGTLSGTYLIATSCGSEPRRSARFWLVLGLFFGAKLWILVRP